VFQDKSIKQKRSKQRQHRAPGPISCHLPRWRLLGAATWLQTKISIANLSPGAAGTLLDFVLGYSTIKDLASQLRGQTKVDCTDSTSLPKTCPLNPPLRYQSRVNSGTVEDSRSVLMSTTSRSAFATRPSLELLLARALTRFQSAPTASPANP
jgi:hypothetical protein